MYKLLGLGIFLVVSKIAVSQSNFSFNCTKDTTIECTTSCLTLNTVIPDIHASTTSYSVNQISVLSCFRGYVDPADPGSSAQLNIDDRYSPPIDISFPFSFFGTTYSQLIASTNGFLSFDISKTGTFSHFGILKNGSSLSATAGTPQDLPSPLYDRALIMGPYHDLDPNISTATQQIKYEVVGSAPYRKWIISYYNVPLYTTVCLNLNYNTHQIVLYETLGIVEIFIYDKEICANWNNGRAIIGMQDFNKTSSITAPGRQASSPAWGGKGFNESWRFVPASGQSLFKRVELYTISGSFLANGSTSNAGNNLLNVSFPNICPPSSGATYLVKSFYANPNDPSSEIMGIDTINISRGDPIVANIIPAACAAGSKGVVTITNPLGPTYEYSLDAINWQPSPVFNLTGGSYTLRTRIIGSNCISTKNIFVETESFDASIIKVVTPCPGPITATLQIFPQHGVPPYNYSLNNGAVQSSNLFTGLAAGVYHVLVTDASGCLFSTDIKIDSTNLAEAVVSNTICGKPGSGTIDVSVGFGVSPYSYSINGGAFQSSSTFTGLAAGTYSITVKDGTGCSYTFNAAVNADVIINMNPSITMPACYGDKNGSITLHPSSGIRPYFFSINDQPFQSDSTFTNLANGSYRLRIKDSTGCIKDSSIIVQQPNPVSGTAIIVPASSCFSKDGEITVKANGGVIPFMYSIDGGANFQVSNVFTQPAGTFNIIIIDSNKCKATISDTIPAANNRIAVDAGPDKTICAGSSTTLSVTSDRPLTKVTWTPASALNNQPSQGPIADPRAPTIASPADTTKYYVIAGNTICTGIDSVTINVLHKPIANAGPDTTICLNTHAVLNGSTSDLSGGVSYLWLPSNAVETPNSASTVVRPRTVRSHKYRLQVTDNYGCNFKVFDDVIVTMNGPVNASAGNDTIAAMGMPHQLIGSGGVEYLWTPANVLDKPNSQEPFAVLQNDTRFNVIVKDILGCIGTSSVFVKVYKGPAYYIPNAFTPNGDGLNDVFKAIAPGIKKTDYFRIFDRWGKIVFETQNLTRGWDGRYAGTPQPPAVYVWIIKGTDITGKLIEMKGIVTLVR